MSEADDRTTLGIVDGSTRTYDGITGDLVSGSELKGTDAITQIMTMVGSVLNCQLIHRRHIKFDYSAKSYMTIDNNIPQFLSISLEVK